MRRDGRGGGRTRQEVVLLTLAACSFLGIAPFALFRLLRDEQSMLLFDLVLLAIIAGLGLHVWLTGRVVLANTVVAGGSLLAVMTALYLGGPSQVVWAYPAVIVVYYLQPWRRALPLALLMSLCVVIMLAFMVEGLRTLQVLATLAVTNVYAFILAKTVVDRERRLEELVGTDALTGVGNRRALRNRLRRLLAAQRRRPRQSSLIMLDLDHFKAVNDRFGHRVGDRVLVGTAQLLGQRLRGSDTVYRYGGEEFLVLLEDTGGDGALRLAQELRERIADTPLVDGWQLTASFGIAAYRSGEDRRRWLQRADEAMYAAKRGGRNRCVLAQ